jgi:NAD(P)-dependent dehydrogenase (short-subunit alcohol dehydrogenase family)
MPNVVITGANRGIGLAFCQRFIQLGFKVYALCRQSSAELNALDATVISGVDVASDEGLLTMQQALANISIDVLINNAGIFNNERLGALNSEAILSQFKVNALAPLQVVDRLKNQLGNNAKIAFITSRMGSISDNGSGEYYGYRMSKAALNAAAMSITRDLADEGISVGIYHPGWVQTQMVNHTGDISAVQAADKLSALIIQQTLATSGQFKHSNGETLPW